MILWNRCFRLCKRGALREKEEQDLLSWGLRVLAGTVGTEKALPSCPYFCQVRNVLRDSWDTRDTPSSSSKKKGGGEEEEKREGGSGEKSVTASRASLPWVLSMALANQKVLPPLNLQGQRICVPRGGMPDVGRSIHQPLKTEEPFAAATHAELALLTKVDAGE